MATLGMGGWLALAQQGLSPCKKRQASLGALTASMSGAAGQAKSGGIPERSRARHAGIAAR